MTTAMPATGFTFNIEKLNDSNYVSWKVTAKAGLTWHDVWEAVEPGYGEKMTPEQEKVNNKATSFLILVIENPVRRLLSSLERAKDVWTELSELFTDSCLSEMAMLLRTELFNVKLQSGESIINYLDRVDETYDQLIATQEKPKAIPIVNIILAGLPAEYAQVVSQLKECVNLTRFTVAKSLLHREKVLKRWKSCMENLHG